MRRAAVALVLAALALVVGACGVEVPDEVADDLREEQEAESTTTAPATTETPRSDDDLEQALIDNGYSAEEAECGAAGLREVLDDDEVEAIVEADTIEDISPDTARAFAGALQPCVEGSGSSDRPGGDDGEDEDGEGSGIGGMPGLGDDSEGDVSRSRLLSSLISSGLEVEVARCIVDGVFDQLDQDEINALFHAESEDEIPEDVLDALQDVTESCA